MISTQYKLTNTTSQLKIPSCVTDKNPALQSRNVLSYNKCVVTSHQCFRLESKVL